MNGQIPVFTYGTLRVGFANFTRFLDVVEDVDEATLLGAVLLDYQAFPFAVHTGRLHDQVMGTLLRIRPDAYEDTLARMDALYGYGPLDPDRQYDRRRMTVHAGHSALDVWVYVAAAWLAPRLRAVLPVVPDGDWARHTTGDQPPAVAHGNWYEVGQNANHLPGSQSWSCPTATVHPQFRRAPRGQGALSRLLGLAGPPAGAIQWDFEGHVPRAHVWPWLWWHGLRSRGDDSHRTRSPVPATSPLSVRA